MEPQTRDADGAEPGVLLWGRWPTGTVQRGTVDVVSDAGMALPRRAPAWIMQRGAGGVPSYSLQTHAGAWRSLGELITGADAALRDACLSPQDIDPERLTRFLRFYGPLHDCEQPTELFSVGAVSLAQQCRILAQAWTSPSEPHAVSRYDPDRLDHAINLAITELRRWAYSTMPAVTGLYRHYAASALAAQADRLPMRRCASCKFWLIATRTNRRFCDAACRMHAREGRGERGRFREPR